MHNLGVLYHDGQGVPQSFAQAKQWWEKAAGLGQADAMGSLGSLYANGQGVPQSDKRAVELYRQSAATGDAYGQSCLAVSQSSLM